MPPKSTSSGQTAHVSEVTESNTSAASTELFSSAAGEGPVGAALASAGLRLKQIELVGFKSFRERTVIRMPEGITAIVGPNGCGKSNIVDAIRWTLGEQSARRLRGESMEDVVFCGNENHGPLGMAQVSILFSTNGLPRDQFSVTKNNGKGLPARVPSEIMVTRRYFRSGESEYLINNIPCRLRDIIELFLGTGVGTKAYAIIEQGRVEQLLNAKPEDIRILIEEAAGVTLYRNRRMAAERKMQRTRDNLVRVQDILREVERQINSLKRQTRKAERYREYKQELQQLELWLAQLDRSRYRGRLWETEALRLAVACQVAEVESEIETQEDERLRLRDLLERKQAVRREREGDAIRAQAEVRQREQLIEFSRTRLATAEAQVEQGRADLRAAAERISGLEREIAALQREEAEVAGRKAVTARELAEEEKRLEELTVLLSTVAREVEEAKVQAVDCLAGESSRKNSKISAVERCREIQERLSKVEGQVREAAGEGERLTVEHRSASELSRQLHQRLEELEGVKREAAERLRVALEDRRAWQSVVEELKQSLGQVRSRMESVKELYENREGYSEGVRNLMSGDIQLGCHLVGEILDVPVPLERAVAAALGERLQYLIVEDHEAALSALELLRSAGGGRASLIPRRPRGVSAPASFPSEAWELAQLVHVASEQRPIVDYLLGGVLLVPDLKTALELWRTDGGRWMLVTPEGEVVDAGGVITGGSEPRPEEKILAQRRVLRELAHEAARCEAELARAKEREVELEVRVREASQKLEGVDHELNQVALDAVKAEKDAERISGELRIARNRLRALESEKSELGQRLSQAVDEAEEAEGELAEARSRRELAERSLSNALERERELQQSQESLRQQVTELRIGLAKADERLSACLSRMRDLGATREATLKQETQVGERLKLSEREIEGEKAKLAELIEGLGDLKRDGETSKVAAERARGQVQEVTQALAAVDEARAVAQRKLDELHERRSSLEVELTEQRLAITHLEESIKERHGVDIPDGDTTLPEIDEVATRGRVAELRERLGAMGEVGTAALDELRELEERRAFLREQQADLEKSLDDLRRTVVRLNRTCRERFKETFVRVKETFEETFPKLFEGGRATLKLVDEDNALESGVEVSIQPPGKRLGSLDLLSGGEKALTAVSLIFALFLINPSPFCILDEVDAPLDDANIGRFNRMVTDMSSCSQFILITHNKRTMEVAETLYGITMEERGVSKVVSVRLPD